jgi:aryl-alcohol dehydrogenase-like predicted oxidoreductase
MNRRTIGATDLRVNEIGYGSMNLTTFRQTMLPEKEAIAFLQRGIDEFGLEFIDTADAYCLDEGEMHYGERVIGRALAGERRQRVVVATKGGFTRPGGKWVPDGRPEHLREACEGSLRALGTDRIDLYQFHRPDPRVPIAESLGALVDMQREGKIRHIGVSNFSLAQLEEGMKAAEIVSIQNPLSFIFYSEENQALLDFCQEHHITWISYAPVGGHRNAHRLVEYSEWMRESISSSTVSPYSLALAWLLHISPVVIPIPATTKIEHLAANMAAADIRLTEEEVGAMCHPRSWMELYGESRGAKDYAGAIGHLRKGLEFDATDMTTWHNLACMYALSGEPDRAFEALDRSIELGNRNAEWIRSDEDFDPIRSDPRFEATLNRLMAPSES